MVVDAASKGAALPAAEIAVLIGERGLAGDDVDLTHRLDALRRDRSPRARDARAMAGRWAQTATHNPSQSPTKDGEISAGALLALAYPERIAKSRGGAAGAFLLANGRGAQIDAKSALAREPFLAVAELTGSAASGRILLAAPITLAEIEARFADRIVTSEDISFDPASASLRVRRLQRLGAITLSEQPLPAVANDDAARTLAEGIARIGIHWLPWTNALRQWRDRVLFLRQAEGSDWPDLSDTALAADVDWLAALFAGKTSLAELSADEFTAALAARLAYSLQRRLDTEAPTHFEAPTGSRVPIDYEAVGGPRIAIRVQELFGLDRHPAIAAGKIPLLLELLSPAHRPVQLTRDLPGFWRGSYAAVRADMRGRYPKHPWPDDPLTAPPTRRAKRSGGQ
jgi:ATP-dependent helicase HrpB